MNYPKVSVVTVNFRQPEVTCDMLETLAVCGYPNLEVVLVDNGSLSDEAARWDYYYPNIVHVRSEENLGFAGGTNLGIQTATGDFILMLNNDTYVPKGFLEPMVKLMEQYAHVGIVSPRIVFSDPKDTIQYAGAFIGQPLLGRGTKIGYMELDTGQYNDVRDTELPHGACMLVRKELFDLVGPLPEFYFMYFEEHDFAVQARKLGYGIMFCGESSILHRQSVSMGVGNPRKTYYLHRNRIIFYQRMLSQGAFLAFYAYYLFVGVPSNIFRFIRAGRMDHVRAIGRAFWWNVHRMLGLPTPQS